MSAIITECPRCTRDLDGEMRTGILEGKTYCKHCYLFLASRSDFEFETMQDDSGAGPAAAASASSAPEPEPEPEPEFKLTSSFSSSHGLTKAQFKRRNQVFEPNDIVEVEYALDGESQEKIGFGQVVSMNPPPVSTRSTEEGVRTLTIRWLYQYEDLTDQLDEEDIAAVDFSDGDFAFSTHEDTVNAYNVIAKREMTVEFMFDGDNLEKIKGVKSEDTAPQPATTLPRHLEITKEWLLSYRIWKDTKFGADWWFILNSLLKMGPDRINADTRLRLESIFFDAEKEPGPAEVTWQDLRPHEQVNFCNACGMKRMTTSKWVELKWNVGKHCQQRIQALQSICAFMFRARTEAEQNKADMSAQWLQQTTDNLTALKGVAMDAISGNDHHL